MNAKLKLSKLAHCAIAVSLDHLQSYVTFLHELDKLYFYKHDCKLLAGSMINLLESLTKLEVPGLALGAVRTVAELSDVAGEFSNDEYTFAIKTGMKLIESELVEVIDQQTQARKKQLKQRAA